MRVERLGCERPVPAGRRGGIHRLAIPTPFGVRLTQAFLTLSEVLGHLDRDGVSVFEAD